MNGIDPLLYGGRDNILDNNINRTKKQLTADKENQPVWKKNFKMELQNKISQMREGKDGYKYSSSIVNRNLSRSEVKELVSHRPEAKKLYNAALEFEGYFAEKMFREMKKNVHKSGLINGGRAEEIFDDLLLTERVRDVSRQSEFGLAELMFQQLMGL